jgi:glycosyltransferase involved in cell wall biosynthesis
VVTSSDPHAHSRDGPPQKNGLRTHQPSECWVRRRCAAPAAATSSPWEFLSRGRPDLAIVSQGLNFDGINLAGACLRLRVPYVLLAQKATELIWPEDHGRPYAVRVYRGAQRVAFVSEHNRRLTENQLGITIPGAVVLPNPVLVARRSPLPWPAVNDGEYRLACVGRLFAFEKAQDVLLEVLARDHWRDRPLHVSFHGEGRNRQGLEDMARRLGLRRVSFAGQSPRIEDVWRDHHGLILTSRAEGMPLALLEAMACGRMAVVTDVGGNTEIVEDGVSGFVAAGPVAAAIDDALERAWQRRTDWEAIGAAAAARIAELMPDRDGSALGDLAADELARCASGMITTRQRSPLS